MRPFVLALASGKGGTGKSTLSAAMAVCALQEGGRVAMIDMEPQSSLTLWWRLRGKPTNPDVVDGSGTDPQDDVPTLKIEGYTHIIIDTPPTFIDRIGDAIAAADVVLIPFKASVFDLAAIRAVVDLCKQQSKPFAFVSTDHEPKWQKLNASAAAAVKRMGPLLGDHTTHRAAYPAALNLGKSAAEHPDSRQAREAADELSGIWAAAKKLATVNVGA